jgi:NAD-reducing hydrogenase large subunit
LFGFDAPPEQRNIIAVLERYPEIGEWAIFIRKYGQDNEAMNRAVKKGRHQ